jgi:hypothetical protein
MLVSRGCLCRPAHAGTPRRGVNPKSYTGVVIRRPSQFLDDFTPELVEEWNIGNEDAWSDDETF